MKYIRKTKDTFLLYWNGKEIDETDTKQDAIYLRSEYNLAYKGGVSIIKRRVLL